MLPHAPPPLPRTSTRRNATHCHILSPRPSYPSAPPPDRLQILTFTYPLVGNYGAPKAEVDQYGLQRNLESDQIWVNGIVVQDYSDSKHHWQASRTLSEWMDGEGIPGIAGIDTRALTKHIRVNPNLLGRIETPGNIGAVGTAFTDPHAGCLSRLPWPHPNGLPCA